MISLISLALPALPSFIGMLKSYFLITSLTGGVLCAYKARITHPSPNILDNPVCKKVAEAASGFVVGGVLFPFIPVALVSMLAVGPIVPLNDDAAVERDRAIRDPEGSEGSAEGTGWSFDINIGPD